MGLYEGQPHSKFSTRPTAIKAWVKRLRVHDRVMTSHTCNSGTSRVLTVEFSQRLKMEAVIPAPSDSEVRSMIVFECTEHSADRSSLSLCQIYGHTRLDGQHISCWSSSGRCLLIIYPIARTWGQ